jgi:hypothetical protein
MPATRTELLGAINHNIRRNGRHIYAIAGAPSPRFAYTIGMRESIGAELVLAGAAFFDLADVQHILDTIADRLRGETCIEAALALDGLGAFTLRRAHPSWVQRLLLGALDYYNLRDIPAYQVVPDDDHWTIDVPDLDHAYSVEREPVWRWIHEPWSYGVPETSIAVTNLAALRGAPITTAGRMDDDAWELFAGAAEDIADADIRAVPLGTLLGADPTLAAVTRLRVGAGLERSVEREPWRAWHAGY